METNVGTHYVSLYTQVYNSLFRLGVYFFSQLTLFEHSDLENPFRNFFLMNSWTKWTLLFY